MSNSSHITISCSVVLYQGNVRYRTVMSQCSAPLLLELFKMVPFYVCAPSIWCCHMKNINETNFSRLPQLSWLPKFPNYSLMPVDLTSLHYLSESFLFQIFHSHPQMPAEQKCIWSKYSNIGTRQWTLKSTANTAPPSTNCVCNWWCWKDLGPPKQLSRSFHFKVVYGGQGNYQVVISQVTPDNY